jgi:hypothetical protein
LSGDTVSRKNKEQSVTAKKASFYRPRLFYEKPELGMTLQFLGGMLDSNFRAVYLYFRRIVMANGIAVTRPPFNPHYSNEVAGVSQTIGTQSSDDITVSIQALGPDMQAGSIRGPVALDAYLSDEDDGLDLLTTAHSGGVAAGANGVVIPLTANKVFKIITNDEGLANLVLTESGAKTAYLVVCLPDGRISVSGPITHV